MKDKIKIVPKNVDVIVTDEDTFFGVETYASIRGQWFNVKLCPNGKFLTKNWAVKSKSRIKELNALAKEQIELEKKKKKKS